MKPIVLSISILLTTLMLVSCGPSLEVTSDYDKAVDFGQFRTFSIYTSDKSTISDLNQRKIITAVKDEMQKKGFSETDSLADVLVNTVAIVKDKVSLNSTTGYYYYGYGGAYRPYYWGGVPAYTATNYHLEKYKEGSLIIDVIEKKTNHLIREGTGNSEIDKPIENADALIHEAVSKIMSGFPPGTKKKQ